MRYSAAEVVVEGRVQGVGYRDFARRRALDRGLTGYAVNLRTGAVKVRVEGVADAIEAYVRDLEHGPPLAAVTRVSVTPAAYSGQFREFGIRYVEPA